PTAEDCDDNDSTNTNSNVNDADCDGVPSDIDCDDTDPTVTTTNVGDADCDGVPTAEDCDDNDSTNTNSNVNDADCDGVPSDMDCDDTDPTVTTTNVGDADCDGVSTAEDCDDNDSTNTNSNVNDADCDGVPSDIDCDDTDPTVTTTNVGDADCDGVPTAEDCDDNDTTNTNSNVNDADCDGVPSDMDCDDTDPTVTTTIGSTCDDNDPCTTNEVLDADCNCVGTLLTCATGPTTTQACDDNNPNTFDDVLTILDCDGSICEPCMGIPCQTMAIIQDIDNPIPCDQITGGVGVMLSAEGSTQGPGIDYQWTFNGATVGSNVLSVEVFDEGVYTLTVSDANGCLDSDQVEVVFSDAELVPVITVNAESCAGFNDGFISVDTVAGGEAPYLYSFDQAAYTPTNVAGPLAPGTYSVGVQDLNGCEVILDVQVAAAPFLVLDLGPDEMIRLGDSLQLSIDANFAIDTIQWTAVESISCTDCDKPIVRPTVTTTYQVTVTSTNGCVLTDEITISVDGEVYIYIPDVFSPNDDGINDDFEIYPGIRYEQIRQFTILDRWGDVVFDEAAIPFGEAIPAWDGKARSEQAPIGVYVYFVEVELADGRVEVLTGEVLLLR
ncbi:MAG: gliding motility-associated C-terminal domain-containing protein, partial [Bacteroidota bacterium]